MPSINSSSKSSVVSIINGQVCSMNYLPLNKAKKQKKEFSKNRENELFPYSLSALVLSYFSFLKINDILKHFTATKIT